MNNRLLIFSAGLIAGFGAAFLSLTAFPYAQAAPPELEAPVRKLPPAAVEPKFFEQRCAPGFKHSPAASGRYTCNRIAAVRCPGGTAPSGLKLYRSGNASGTSRLVYECRMSEAVPTHCGRGFVPAKLQLYRSGAASGGARLIYECVRYRSGK